MDQRINETQPSAFAAVKTPQPVRILIDPQPSLGRWNMAVDEALLESALLTGQCTVRWYAWSEPTISLGYFQSADLWRHSELGHLPAVRRLSGGGALLHDQELTYSCVLPPSHPLVRIPPNLYVAVHEAILGVLHRLGVQAALRGASERQHDDEFLCFNRGEARDVILSGSKILGSAQRRRRGAILQHGGLLLRASKFAPQFPGMFDQTGHSTDPGALASALADAVARVLGPQCLHDRLTPSEERLANHLMQTRYASPNRS